MVTRGENCHVRWEWSCEVRIATRGGNGHATYEPPSEILHSLIFCFLLPRFIHHRSSCENVALCALCLPFFEMSRNTDPIAIEVTV